MLKNYWISTSMNKYHLILFISVFMHSTLLHADIPKEKRHFYIGKTGIIHSSCTVNSRKIPWASLSALLDKNCAQSGDIIFFRPGIYYEEKVIISASGNSDNPIIITAVPSSKGELVAKIITNFIYVSGNNIVFDGLEIEGENTPSSKGILTLDGHNIKVKNVYVHGDEKKYAGGFDCIKIIDSASNIHILSNHIAYCGEDAIDVTGARNVIYRDNYIHHAKMMQVKGGTENILIENNVIHDLAMGIQGFNMKCWREYCGGAHIPNLPVEQRYVAKNIVIRKNKFFNIGTNAIGPSGFVDARISSNSFHVFKGPALKPHMAGFDFYDDISSAYCKKPSNGCRKCGVLNKHCSRIVFANKNVSFNKNSFHTEKGLIWYDNMNVEGINFSNNIYYSDSHHHNHPIPRFAGKGNINKKLNSVDTR